MPIVAGASAEAASAVLPRIFWYPLIALPLFVAIALAVRLNGISLDILRIRRGDVENQLLIALHGIPLGSSAYYILRPEPLVPGAGFPGMLAASVVLLAAVAFLEEFLFRGVLQQTLSRVLHGSALILVSLLFAATYFSTRSPAFILLMAGVGFLFGIYVRLSRCLWGVTVAHALLVIGLLIAWPRLLA
jgi:membrane protease YdiL (CAAX protease family)